jgi:hypothetical protein
VEGTILKAEQQKKAALHNQNGSCNPGNATIARSR